MGTQLAPENTHRKTDCQSRLQCLRCLVRFPNLRPALLLLIPSFSVQDYLATLASTVGHSFDVPPFEEFSPIVRAYNGNASTSSSGCMWAPSRKRRTVYYPRPSELQAPPPTTDATAEILLRPRIGTTIPQTIHFHAPSSSFRHSSPYQIDIDNGAMPGASPVRPSFILQGSRASVP